jgi:hypothetical protein
VNLRQWAPVLLERCASVFGDAFVRNKFRKLPAFIYGSDEKSRESGNI